MLDSLTLYRLPYPTLSRRLLVLRDYQGDKLPQPKHEVPGSPPGERALGRPQEGLPMFHPALVWYDKTFGDEHLLCSPWDSQTTSDHGNLVSIYCFCTFE